MKKRLLIVTEDIIQIQTFSGKIGNLYSILYQIILKFKLRLAIFILHHQYDITVLSTDKYAYKNATFLSYSDQLDPSKMVGYKPLAWKIYKAIDQLISDADKNFSKLNSISLIGLWQNKITSRLMNYYLDYLELITRLVVSRKYSHLLILGNSVQEQVANFLSSQYQFKLLNYSAINLNSLTNIFFRYFRQREITKKLEIFKIQSQRTGLSQKLFSNSVLLSVDLFRHLKTLIPVYNQLQQFGAKPLFIADELAMDTYLKNLEAENSNYVFLANFLSKKDIENNVAKWQPITDGINEAVIKSIDLKPKDVETLFLKLIFPEVSPIIRQGLILSRLYLLAGEKLITTLKPKSVIVAADVRLTELSLSYLAKAHSLSSLTVSPRTMMFADEPYQYNLTDFISVTGSYAQNQLIKLNVLPERIIINGDPSYDYFNYLSKNFSRKKSFQRLGIRPVQKKIILLISERPNLYLTKKEKRDYFLQVSQAMKDYPEFLLVVKPHPTEKKYRLMEELRQWGITNAIVSDNQKIELFNLIKLSSIVVMIWSMTGLEAMMLKRPVIIVNPHKKNFDKYIPYLKNKAAVEANTSSSLSEYLDIYSNHQHLETKKLIALGLKFSEHYIRKPDGQVAQRIAQFVLEKN